MKDNKFPKFWFDSNFYFGWVESMEELEKVYGFNISPGNPNRTFNEFLKECKQNHDKSLDFGLRVEHSGLKTLYDFLIESNIKIK